MRNQTTCKLEVFVALRALMPLLIRVGNQVRGQVTALGKGFVALLAFKRPLTRVNVIVLFQILL